MDERKEPDPDDTLNALAGAIEAFHKIREYAQLVSPEISSAEPKTSAQQDTAPEQLLATTPK